MTTNKARAIVFAACVTLVLFQQRRVKLSSFTEIEIQVKNIEIQVVAMQTTYFVSPYVVRITANVSEVTLTLQSSFSSNFFRSSRLESDQLKSCRALLVGDTHGKTDVAVEICRVPGRMRRWLNNKSSATQLLTRLSDSAQRDAARKKLGRVAVRNELAISMCIAPLYNVKHLSPAALTSHIDHHASLGVAHTFLYTVDRPADFISRLKLKSLTGLHVPWVSHILVHSRAQNWVNNDCVHRAAAHGFDWALSIDIDEFVVFNTSLVTSLSMLVLSSSARGSYVGGEHASEVITFGSRVALPQLSSIPSKNASHQGSIWCEIRPSALVAREDEFKYAHSVAEFSKKRTEFNRRSASGIWEGSRCSFNGSSVDGANKSRGASKTRTISRRPIDPRWWDYVFDLQHDIDHYEAMSKLGLLSEWISPEGEWKLPAQSRKLVRVQRREHNAACIDEALARRAEREPELCLDWRGRRKWLVATSTIWVVNIHSATVCRHGECRQWQLHASREAWLLHMSRPGDGVWATMPGAGSTWNVVKSLPPPSASDGTEGTLNCMHSSHVWITVGRGDGAAPLFGETPAFCHEHLIMSLDWMNQFAYRRRSFWRNRWLLVHEYLQAHPALRLAILSDA